MRYVLIATCLIVSACSPFAGPDKSVSGAILGGGIGAGSGAIIGNQVGMTGPGIAIGAGMAAAGGLMSGIGLDLVEGAQLDSRRKLKEIDNLSKRNEMVLANMQANHYEQANQVLNYPAFMQVFFDKGNVNLKSSSAYQLAHLAKVLGQKRYGTYSLIIKAYSTDSSVPDYNRDILRERAKNVIASLISHGISPKVITDSSTYYTGLNVEDYEKKVKDDLLLIDQTEPLNRYNNRVEIFVSY